MARRPAEGVLHRRDQTIALTVALTFDDGPSRWTLPILDALAVADDRATFFVLGSNIAGYEKLLARMVKAGHEIAVHGWDHTRWLRNHDQRSIELALRRTIHLIEDTCDVTPRLWRPPWHALPTPAVKASLSLGLRYVPVTIDARDASRDATLIYEDVLGQLEDGAVIGLHDGIAPNGEQIVTTRDNTVAAVRRILEHCHSATVSDLHARVRA